MKLLVDNDVIHKLAAYDLLPEAVSAKVGTSCQIFLGPRTRFSMCVRKNREKGQVKFGADVHARIVTFVEGASTISDRAGDADFATITAAETSQIDEGEALLFAASASDSNAYVATGDHRSIEALATLSSCASIVGRLQGRIMIVEHFVLAAIASLGFQQTLKRMLPGISIDMGIHAAAFGSGDKTEEATAKAGLLRRIEDLRRRAGGTLHP